MAGKSSKGDLSESEKPKKKDKKKEKDKKKDKKKEEVKKAPVLTPEQKAQIELEQKQAEEAR